VAGALPLADAARVICSRARLLAQVSGRGAMAVVDLSPAKAAEALASWGGDASVAASNSPGSTVLSGETSAIEQIVARLESSGVVCRRIKVDVASHSAQVDSLRAPLEEAIAGL